MPIPACCIKGKFYAKSALLYSKGSFYASDVGIKLSHVAVQPSLITSLVANLIF